MSLVPSTTQASVYDPPQAKQTRAVLKGGAFIAIVLLGAWAVTKFVPTLSAAVELLTKLTTDLTFLAINIAVFAVVGTILASTFSPTGKINKLISMQFSSMFNRLIWASLNIDPLSPFYDRQTEVRAYKANLEHAAGQLSGVMERVQSKAQAYAKEAQQHEGKARGAQSDPRFQNMLTTEARARQRCLETAQTFQSMYEKLVPVRSNVQKLMEAAQDMDQNLDLEIRIARDTWDIQGALDTVNKASVGIFRQSEKQAIAAKAQQVIDDRYADSLGQMRNLTQLMQPTLDSIDLEKATAREDLLLQFQNESTLLLDAPKPVGTSDPSSLRALIK